MKPVSRTSDSEKITPNACLRFFGEPCPFTAPRTFYHTVASPLRNAILVEPVLNFGSTTLPSMKNIFEPSPRWSSRIGPSHKKSGIRGTLRRRNFFGSPRAKIRATKWCVEEPIAKLGRLRNSTALASLDQ